MEEPRFAAIHFEDDRLAGVFEAVVLLPVGEAVEVAAPVEAVKEGGFFVEVEIHGGGDAAADAEAEAAFAFVGEVGDDFDLGLFIDEEVQGPGADVVLGGFGAAFLFVDPPFVGLGEDGLADGALFSFGGLGGVAEMEDFFDAENLEQPVFATDGGEGFFDEGAADELDLDAPIRGTAPA